MLLYYVQQGDTILRLDAVAYLWKEIGTNCIHLPQTHEIVKLFRTVLDLAASLIAEKEPDLALVYLERDDILPGARKTLRLPVPPGRHRFELRCPRPQTCGIAAQIRIPTADIDRKRDARP